MNGRPERKSIRDMIVPRTRVCHALTRVFLYAILPLSLTLPIAGPPLASAEAEENQKVVRKMPPGDLPGGNPHYPGDPGEMQQLDFEGPILYNPDQDMKDHTVVLSDGVFHVFYIVANDRTFGHATSTDLHRWTFHEPVLTKGEPGEWDEKDIWAPCVAPFEGLDGYYMMYYTGVNAFSSQSTGLAYSSGDLFEWTKVEGELPDHFACDTSWCNWDESKYCHFRDPNLFEDDDGSFWLTHTARTKDDYGAVALTGGDGRFTWYDAGPMYVHENWHLLESTFLLKHDGLYHLLFTEEGVGGISHMFSDHLTSGWDIMYRVIIDFGHAAEITETPSGAEIFSRHTAYLDYTGDLVYSIRFDTLAWSGDLPVVNLEAPLSNWTVLWGDVFQKQPVFGNAFAFRGDDTTSVGYEGNWWIGTAERFNGPIFGTRPGSYRGDIARGAARSKTFTVTGRSMSLLVGGGNYADSCWVALKMASSNEVLYKETGRGIETMDRRYWNLEPFMGEDVYIEIVDNCSTIMGHINVDSIKESPFPLSTGDPPGSPPGGGHVVEDLMLQGAPVSAPSEDTGGGPGPRAKVSCSPNPFNPATTINFTAGPNKSYEVVVFSIAGRRIRTGRIITSPDGSGSMMWDGRNDSGAEVASGVYAAAVIDSGRILGIAKLVLLR